MFRLLNFLSNEFFQKLFLVLLIFSIPIFEAPKNIFFLAFIVSWILLSYKKGDWGGRWIFLDSLFFVWILINLAVAFHAYFFLEQPFNGMFDILRYIIFGWVISRYYFTNKELKRIVLTVIISTLSIFYSFYFSHCYELYYPINHTCLKLNSVGHVNHTTIYLILSVILALSSITTEEAIFKKKFFKFLFGTYAFSITYLVFISQSRASILSFLVFIFLFLFYIFKRISLKFKFVIPIMIIFSSMFFITNSPGLVEKVENTFSSFENGRLKIWNFSLEVFKLSPIFGVGMDNYPNYNFEDFKENIANNNIENTRPQNKDLYMPFSHPHNVYLHFLVGGGIIFASFFVFFWVYILYKLISKKALQSPKWIDFATINVVISILLIGLFNTSLANENALLVFLIVGIYVSKKMRNFK